MVIILPIETMQDYGRSDSPSLAMTRQRQVIPGLLSVKKGVIPDWRSATDRCKVGEQVDYDIQTHTHATDPVRR